MVKSMSSQKSYLLTKEAIATRNDLPQWFKEEYQHFHETVTRPDFPCYFGMGAEKKGELRYTFITHNNWNHLPNTVREFLEELKKPPFVRMGLFLFVEPEIEAQSISYYRKYFWDLLQYLHNNDQKEWPEQIPTDPDHYLWAFSFDGEPMFVFGNSPAYKQRKTRNLGKSLILGMQPRRIFEGLEGDQPGGMKSRNTVRERVEKWDNLPKHPDISHYGDKEHREWKQYLIGDDMEPVKGKCPFHHS